MKQFILACTALLVIATGCAAKPNTQQKTADQLTIGAILPLSGDFAVLGQEIQRGMELTADRYSGTSDIRLLYEDDKSLDHAAIASAANKLISIDKVDVGTTMLIEQGEIAGPIFNSSKVPLLVSWDNNKRLLDTGPYTFSSGFSTEHTAQKMAAFAKTKLNVQRVAVLSHHDPFSEIISRAFIDEFVRQGGKVTMHESTPVEETDYRTVITKIKQTHPDAIYAPLIPMTNTQFLTQARELGVTSTLLGADSYISDVIHDAGAAAEGLYITNYYTDQANELRTLYEDRYKEQPIDPALVSFGYESVKTILDAYTKGNGDIKTGLDDIFGPSRASQKVERLYRVTDEVLRSIDF